MPEIRFDGQRVLVTAGAWGIGKAIVESFIEAGARVHTCDVNQAKLDALVASTPTVTASLTDVGDRAAVKQLFQDADQALGGLDILVANAGIKGPTKPADEIDLQEWDRTLAVNLTGAYQCAQLAIPRLKANPGGNIVMISALRGLHGFEDRTPYAASKWAMIGVAKSLALELGPFGIRVNCVDPAGVVGDRQWEVLTAEAERSGRTFEELRAEFERGTALGVRPANQDIADMVLFACSGMAAKVTGQVLVVDAGAW
jgi:NAD(P)-dependent dehydrogenase (short-subunit alcohol dehydrogenase family)